MSDAGKKILSELLKQCVYLNSFADIIRTNYGLDELHGCYNYLAVLNPKKDFFQTLDKGHDYSLALQNLRNAWYHESAFIQDNSTSSEKMKFTAWKIIQFYYGIYCALSAIVRCKTNSKMGHEKMINYFTTNILTNISLRTFFPVPFCFTLDQNGNVKPPFTDRIDWEYGLKFKCPEIERCLREIFNGKQKSAFHYFYKLRQWVNYEDTYIFRRFYAISYKPSMYRDMNIILSAFISIAEVFLMNTIGYDTIASEAWQYIEEFPKYMEENATELASVTMTLRRRFGYYKTRRDWFLSPT